MNYSINFFHTKKFKEEKAFNSWNFTTTELWDEFWFDRYTSLLVRVPRVIIGSTAPESPSIRAYSTKTTYKDKEVEAKVMGIPYKMKDKIDRKLVFEKPLTLN